MDNLQSNYALWSKQDGKRGTVDLKTWWWVRRSKVTWDRHINGVMNLVARCHSWSSMPLVSFFSMSFSNLFSYSPHFTTGKSGHPNTRILMLWYMVDECIEHGFAQTPHWRRPSPSCSKVECHHCHCFSGVRMLWPERRRETGSHRLLTSKTWRSQGSWVRSSAMSTEFIDDHMRWMNAHALSRFFPGFSFLLSILSISWAHWRCLLYGQPVPSSDMDSIYLFFPKMLWCFQFKPSVGAWLLTF